MQKAWYYEEHGPKEVLKMGYFPIPTPKHDQLLVQVKAAALNPIDVKIRRRPLVVPVHFPVSTWMFSIICITLFLSPYFF